VTTPVGAQRYYIPPVLTVKQAALMAAGAALGGKKITHRLLDAQLVFAPLWDLHGEVEGWISWKRRKRQIVVEEVRTGWDGSEYAQKKILEEGGERYKRMVSWEGRNIIPGIKVGEFGLYEVKDEQFSLLRPYDEAEMHRYGTVFTPQDPSQGDALEHARQYYQELVLSPYSQAEEVHHRLKVTRQGPPLLIYYPLWVVRYLSGRRLYRLTLDAATGNVVFLDEPRKRVRLNLVLALVGLQLLALLATTPLSAFRSPGQISEAFALLVMPMFGAGVVLMLWLEHVLWERFADCFTERFVGEFIGRFF
jgi:hypothetical protein